MPWRLEHFLLDDLRMTTAQVMGAKGVKPHPSRPKPRRASVKGEKPRMTPAERKRRLADLQRRAEERRRRLEAADP